MPGMVNTLKTALLVSALTSMVGCSTIGDGIDSAGSGMIKVGEAYGQATSKVNIEELAEKKFKLTTHYNEPVASLDSWTMRIEARELCPEGYIYLNRLASKQSAFGVSSVDCVGGSCGYKLEWQIECRKLTEEPFSFFGKT